MRELKARQILQSLVEGVDPFDGSELPPGTILQKAEVLRALLAGVSALEEGAARALRRAQKPSNVGRPWTEAEQEELLAAFHRGDPLDQVAARHGRTLRAIEARLQKIGLLSPEQRTTRDRFPVPSRKE